MSSSSPGRRSLVRVLPAVAAGWLAASACSRAEGGSSRAVRPLSVLVYRGPAACDGCAEAVAALLGRSRRPFTVRYTGPGGNVPLTADGLAGADVYVQPGGGDDLGAAWDEVRGAAGAIRDWTRGGGRYLGFCMGGYLAGTGPGFGLLPGDTDAYTATPGASVHDARDTVVAVRWRGEPRHMYFQDGPVFLLDEGADASVLATYGNGTAAAVVAPYGRGRVGVVGPHPEADASWYAGAGLPTGIRRAMSLRIRPPSRSFGWGSGGHPPGRRSNPDGVRFDLGRDLVEETVRGL